MQSMNDPIRRTLCIGAAVLAVAGCATQTPVATSADDVPVFQSDADELFYFWGTTFGKQLEAARITDPEEIAWVARGLKDQASGSAPEFGDEYPSLLNNSLVLRTRQAAEAEAALGASYLDELARSDGAIKTETGLVYREIRAGTGEQPSRGSRVKVHYRGRLRDGTVFDSSMERGEPLVARLTQVIGCWSEGIPMMRVGGKAVISCPATLAYGDRGNGRAIPGGAALSFDVELLEILP